jgi:hypothetical protein
MAAGMSIAAPMFPEFVEKITEHLNLSFSSVELSSDKFYDFALEPADMNAEFVRELEKLEPFGCDNNTPVFMTEVGAMQATVLSNHPQHLKLSNGDVQFMYFNGAENAEILGADIPKCIIFEFQKTESAKNDLRGADNNKNTDNVTLRAIVKGIMPTPLCARGYALTLAGVIRGRFAAPDDKKFKAILGNLSIDREEFIKYYKAMRNIRAANGFYDMFSKTEDLDLYQFVFCATVFSELKILSIVNGRVSINDKIATDLFRSSAYNFVREKGQQEKCLTSVKAGEETKKKAVKK